MINLYIVNAFTQDTFGGNPAAVCLLSKWLDDTTLQNIASQHNLSETAFIVPSNDADIDYDIRWFTPVCEVDLCGHATLASAYVLFFEENFQKDNIVFSGKTGELSIQKQNDGKLVMDFPVSHLQKTAILGTYHAVFGSKAKLAFQAPAISDDSVDLVLVFDEAEQVINADINFKAMRTLNYRCIIITAKADEVDFVCRVFAPKVGIDEDPVTGSAFTLLTPLWTEQLAAEATIDKTTKEALHAKQVSKKGGDVWTTMLSKERVMISGYAKLYAKGSIQL